ncbi:anaerobic C4-dicarboxylate transporter DcuC [Aeromonas simiae]|uniref:anaerobic C4-dicarboxylate transporter DcuC n=1 Tax=Aeromonas simiae TaxID=218936 RepID=UPI00266DA265|nr:anaerobic C4-dicarboxylate transporter DcuC [Aeromonas simiae]MDO2948553.1 anaerobic C4-dicarboxylate transporter DcuC [Aeromonas simiae]MDO2951441.1 anaerobic C4-dicarboxylate transporter DcuC [Aeromonas simiae]MDO2955936.1 anaerobic C4-dicarboxylate transporter DcuC [Aeromonas simiae]
MLSLLIGTLITLLVGRAIFKGYSATGVLLGGGLLLLAITALMGRPILPAKVASTGYLATDIFEYVRFLLNDRGGGLGMLIMVLCGFAGYMGHIGANDILVKLASRPLRIIRSPYLLLVAAYLVACAMSLAVSSATGLGVLLMATLFPLMVNMGISRGAAAAVCASPAAIILAPTSGDVVMAAQAANMELLDFAFRLTLPISLLAIACMAVTHFFWQRYLDRRAGERNEPVAPSELKTTAPAFYAILPFTPIIGVLIFDGKSGPQLDIVTIIVIVICMVLVCLLELLRLRSGRLLLDGLQVCWRHMADAFAGVVMLLVGAGVFAQGLMTIGFIDTLLAQAQSFGSGAMIMMLALVVITTLAAFTTGSGNAPFYAFVELIPSLATSLGINPAYLVIPMLQASNLGRTVSPVSGVVVACSGMANLSPFEVVKRTSLPVAVGLLVVILATQIMVPL